MMDYSPVSTRTVEGSRSGRWPTVLGLALVTGLLVLLGFVSAASRAEAAEAPAGLGTAAASPALVGKAMDNTGPGILRDAPHPCVLCAISTTTTEPTTTTKNPCHICGTTTTTTTTTTPTTTTTHSTVPSTTTSHSAGHAVTHHRNPPQLAYTGTSPALVPMLAIGSLLVVLGALLFVIVPARARRRSTTPTD
jgi:hypothetical protein